MTYLAALADPVPADLADEFLKRLPYISEGLASWELASDRASVNFRVRSGFEANVSEIAARIAEVAGKMFSAQRAFEARVLHSRVRQKATFSADPHPLLAQIDELSTCGRGRYGYGPLLVRLLQVFDEMACAMAVEFHASSRQFPSLIGADVLDRCRYLSNFPSSLNLVFHLREDLARIQEFARTVRCDEHQSLSFDTAALSAPECLLSPSVCFHWYNWLRDRKLPAGGAITAQGKCFRYESANLTGLERLWDFTMREIIFVGPPDYVLENRKRLLDLTVGFLDKLDLTYEIATATDPFFVDSYAIQATFQQGFELKYEMLVTLPYSGRKLAVGSINYHQDFFGRSFQIEAAGQAAHTGCLGFGLERLALAFLAQHGLEVEAWPEVVRQRMEGSGY